LFPILLSDLSSTHLNAIVAQLTNTDQFKAPFSIPTVALNDPQFCPTFDADLMWRGPVWGFTNWFILEGRSAQLSSLSSLLSSPSSTSSLSSLLLLLSSSSSSSSSSS
jgi:hypothetical protein